jgi:hypothetical protein
MYMSIYDGVLGILLCIKMLVLFYWLKHRISPSKESKEKLDYYEKIFTVLMAFLMIYLFNPFRQYQVIDRETKLFLCVFAILTLAHSTF